MTKDFKPLDLLSSDELQELRVRKDWKNLCYILVNWIQIFICMIFLYFYPSFLTFCLGVMIVGSRQFALAVLMHEGAHGLLFKDQKTNDWVTQWFCAFPIFNDNRPYKSYHLLHHRFTETKKDPDLSLSAPFPITRFSFFRKTFRDLIGLTGLRRYAATLRSIFYNNHLKKFTFSKDSWNKLKGFFITNFILLLLTTYFLHWSIFFTLWWLPAFTYYSLIIRIRNIAEHAVTPKTNNLNNTRTTKANFLLRYFMAPLNVNYHLEHHLFTNCPWYNLPRAHYFLEKNGFLDRMCVEDSYYRVLNKATRG